MGLRDKLKKKSEVPKGEEKPEEIGGLLANANLPDLLAGSDTVEGSTPIPDSSGDPFVQESPGASIEAQEDPETEEDDDLSALDIFTSEVAEDEGTKLAEQLPEVDIQDLLMECQEIAAKLKQDIS